MPETTVTRTSEEFSISQGARGMRELLYKRGRGLDCACCGGNLTGIYVDAYPHSNGWSVLGYFERYWLSIHCPKCGYDTSFDKFDISPCNN